MRCEDEAEGTSAKALPNGFVEGTDAVLCASHYDSPLPEEEIPEAFTQAFSKTTPAVCFGAFVRLLYGAYPCFANVDRDIYKMDAEIA
jgi:hypothetical protein